MEKSNIIIEAELRPATHEDFYTSDNGEKKRHVTMPFFIRNASNRMECYNMRLFTDLFNLAELIADGQVFVFAQETLDRNVSGAIIRDADADELDMVA